MSKFEFEDYDYISKFKERFFEKEIERYVEEENIDFNEYKEMYDAAVYKWANVDGVNIQRRFR